MHGLIRPQLPGCAPGGLRRGARRRWLARVGRTHRTIPRRAEAARKIELKALGVHGYVKRYVELATVRG